MPETLITDIYILSGLYDDVVSQISVYPFFQGGLKALPTSKDLFFKQYLQIWTHF